MTKRLVDIDDARLESARAELGTSTIKQTIDEALRRVVAGRAERVSDALDTLAEFDLEDREDAWR